MRLLVARVLKTNGQSALPPTLETPQPPSLLTCPAEVLPVTPVLSLIVYREGPLIEEHPREKAALSRAGILQTIPGWWSATAAALIAEVGDISGFSEFDSLRGPHTTRASLWRCSHTLRESDFVDRYLRPPPSPVGSKVCEAPLGQGSAPRVVSAWPARQRQISYHRRAGSAPSLSGTSAACSAAPRRSSPHRALPA